MKIKTYITIQAFIIIVLGGASLVSLYNEGYYMGFGVDIILQLYLIRFYIIREVKKTGLEHVYKPWSSDE